VSASIAKDRADGAAVLAFDCAVTGLAVAVVRDGAVLALHCREGRDQAATLMPAIADTLDRAATDRRAISMIAVTIGPGSFTGVRVGLAAARGLAVALDVPLAGIATTSALLAQAPRGDGVPVAAIDTKLGDWYCAMEQGAPFLATAEVLAKKLAGRPCVIVGPDAGPLAAALPAARAHVVPVDPVVLARLALTDGVDGWRARNAADGLPRPLYLRGVNVTSPDGSRRTVE
jgi:tRNA threonylcarbamoyladenosine biosynthesis protein TsaB